MTRPSKFRVLLAVNLLRARHGKLPILRLPKGRSFAPDACPIAQALGATGVLPGYVGNDPTDLGVYTMGDKERTLPLTLSKFGRYVDRGEYPELEA